MWPVSDRNSYSYTHLHNFILVYSQDLLLRESSLSTFEQCSFSNLKSVPVHIEQEKVTYIHISKRASGYESDIDGEEGIGVSFTFEF